jgi:hypothetical protein
MGQQYQIQVVIPNRKPRVFNLLTYNLLSEILPRTKKTKGSEVKYILNGKTKVRYSHKKRPLA